MNSITKDTVLPISLVIMVIGLAFSAGKSSTKLDSLDSKVQAFEVQRVSRDEAYNAFQIEVITRLTRIETALKQNRKGE